jgi:ABC-2 type transport system permease protein
VWRVTAALCVLVGIMSVLAVTRHTRADEQAGRRELLGATAVGRQAPLASALAVVLAADVAIGLLSAGGMVAMGLGGGGALLFGLGIAAAGWVFAAVAAVAAQLTTTSRSANGIGIGVVAGSFLLRVAGDAEGSGLGLLAWISPIGLVQRAEPYAATRWWPLLVVVVAGTALVAAAWVLSARRDLGAGLLASRSGPPTAAPWLRGPLGLAWRLQQGTSIAWAVGFVVFGIVIGGTARGFVDLTDDTPELADILARLGGDAAVADAFMAALLGVFGSVAAAHGIQVLLRLRAEEAEGRADDLLATATPRSSLLSSQLALAVAAPMIDLVLAGAAAGVTYGLSVGDVGQQLPALVGAALTRAPAAVAVVGLAAALLGLAPRLARSLAWAALALFALVSFLGAGLGIDQAVLNASPFSHSPSLPGSELSATPLLVLSGLAAVLVAGAFAGFASRDIG